MTFRAVAAAIALAASATAAYGQTPQAADPQTKALNISAYVELLRSDVRTQKIAIITEVVGFTDAEDAAFWPIYREYDADLAALGEERVALVAYYAEHYTSLTY